jgi:small ligand-binding sensory domain FIST
MKFLSRTTTSQTIPQIVLDLLRDAQGPYDLGILFVTPDSSLPVEEIAALIKEKAGIRNLLGCSCAGIIGSKEEIERQPAATLILAQMPEVKISPFFMNQAELESLKTPLDWHNYFEIFPNEKPIFLCLPDPFQFDAIAFLQGLNGAYPGAPVIGGLASAAMSPGENILISNGEQFHEGVIGLILTGNVRVDTIVSQGCKPIGKTYIVTAAEENRITSLAGRPFLEVLQKELSTLPTEDQHLAQEAIFV